MKLISYGKQFIDNKDISKVTAALRSDWLTQGPDIAEFEAGLAHYCGAKYAVAVSSGTAALHLACLAVGLRKGDEAITSPLTFLATANCILYCQANPVFADIHAQTANIDPLEVKKNITRRTKAVLPVHLGGLPCDIKRIHRIAKEKGLIIIEDACHALGAKYRYGKYWVKIGSCKHSDMAVFSFHPVKHITTAEGGAVLTNNKTFYKKVSMLRNHGITQMDFVNKPHGQWYYEMQGLGFNYRLTDIQAALGISQLEKTGNFLKKRRRIASLYDSVFSDNPYFDILREQEGYFCSYHLYPIKLKDPYKEKKKELFVQLRKRGVLAQVHYIPVYLQPYYAKLGYRKGLCPVAEDYYSRELSIPIYPAMKEADIRLVIRALTEAFEAIT